MPQSPGLVNQNLLLTERNTCLLRSEDQCIPAPMLTSIPFKSRMSLCTAVIGRILPLIPMAKGEVLDIGQAI
jgi:hypothetical protein